MRSARLQAVVDVAEIVHLKKDKTKLFLFWKIDKDGNVVYHFSDKEYLQFFIKIFSSI